jgi:hypothetical protein
MSGILRIDKSIGLALLAARENATPGEWLAETRRDERA